MRVFWTHGLPEVRRCGVDFLATDNIEPGTFRLQDQCIEYSDNLSVPSRHVTSQQPRKCVVVNRKILFTWEKSSAPTGPVWDKHHGLRCIVLVLFHLFIHSHSTAHRFSSWSRFTDFSRGTRPSLRSEKKGEKIMLCVLMQASSPEMLI